MDLDIAKRIEEEQRAAEEAAVQQALLQSDGKTKEKKPFTEGKFLLFAVLGVIGIFILAMGGLNLYDKMTGAPVTLTIDDLHRMNAEGKLDPEKGQMYHGFSFVKEDGLWWTNVLQEEELVKVPLHFTPKEVEHIPITGELNQTFNEGEEVFIAIDPAVADKHYTLALSELSFNIVKGLDRTPVGSCTKEDLACEGREIISCANNKGKPVIELALLKEAGEETTIELQGTCILIKGSGVELVKAAERVLYQWYQVMG